jgi:hypothetical protein
MPLTRVRISSGPVVIPGKISATTFSITKPQRKIP